MKKYDLQIRNEEREQNLKVSVDSHEEFIKWLDLLQSFYGNEKISFVKIKNIEEEISKKQEDF
tara:strand:- start:289 stop:477 length:189 start_codon:yes stop_codon:yes gene_type:complete